MNTYITIGGKGTRMKGISPKPKFELYYNDKRIIDHLKGALQNPKIIGIEPTVNRWQTLQEISSEEDCWIIDCDIVLTGKRIDWTPEKDTLFYFTTKKRKYGSIMIQDDLLIGVCEHGGEWETETKCSGVYFVKSMKKLLQKMTDKNSIASGMMGAECVAEDFIIKLGDVEDYLQRCQ